MPKANIRAPQPLKIVRFKSGLARFMPRKWPLERWAFDWLRLLNTVTRQDDKPPVLPFAYGTTIVDHPDLRANYFLAHLCE